MLFFEISELELMVAGRPRGLLRGGRFQVLSAPVLWAVRFFLKTIPIDRAHLKAVFNHKAIDVHVGFFNRISLGKKMKIRVCHMPIQVFDLSGSTEHTQKL